MCNQTVVDMEDPVVLEYQFGKQRDKLRESDVDLLKPGQWLTDKVIMFWIAYHFIDLDAAACFNPNRTLGILKRSTELKWPTSVSTFTIRTSGPSYEANLCTG